MLKAETSGEQRRRRDEMLKHLSAYFEEWDVQLSLGNNILVYGWGSKFRLLESFIEQTKNNHTDDVWLTFLGFLPTADTREVSLSS